MLGTVDRDYVYRIADALAAERRPALLARERRARRARPVVRRARSRSWRRCSIASRSRRSCPRPRRAFDDADARRSDYAARFTPETVQLAYQICAQGRADLALAPDEATGFAMTLLRMLAFEPASPRAGSDVARRRASAPQRRRRRARRSRAVGIERRRHALAGGGARAGCPRLRQAPARRCVAVARRCRGVAARSSRSLKLTGMAAQLAAQTELKSMQGNALTLALPATHKHLADKAYADKLKVALEQATGRKLLLAFEVGDAADASLAAQESASAREAQGAQREAGVSRRAVRPRPARAVRRPGEDRYRSSRCTTPT